MENAQVTPENDLSTLGDEVFQSTNEFQGIDIIRLRDYWLGQAPDTELGRSLKFQHLELIELVMGSGFLKDVEISRRNLQRDSERVSPDPDPEDVLHSRH